MDNLVNRFLTWKLPQTFAPDCGISFDGRKDDEWNKNKTWPVGTNLFTAIEAKQMLEHVVGDELQSAINRAEKAEHQRDDLLAAVKQIIEENGHLADGDICTLKVLKDAIAEIEQST